MEYVSRVPAPPLDRFVDDIYCLTGVPGHRRMNVPPMPSAHLFVNLGDPVARFRPLAVNPDQISQIELDQTAHVIPQLVYHEELLYGTNQLYETDNGESPFDAQIETIGPGEAKALGRGTRTRNRAAKAARKCRTVAMQPPSVQALTPR